MIKNFYKKIKNKLWNYFSRKSPYYVYTYVDDKKNKIRHKILGIKID